MTSDTCPMTLYGDSDDTVIVEHHAGYLEEFDAYSGAELIIRSGDDALMIVASFTEHGVWALAPTMLSEAHTLPDWDIVVDAGHDNSPALTVHAPEGATICGHR